MTAAERLQPEAALGGGPAAPSADVSSAQTSGVDGRSGQTQGADGRLGQASGVDDCPGQTQGADGRLGQASDVAGCPGQTQGADGPVPVVIVGPRGFGHYYRRRVADLQAAGRVRLAGIVDVAPPADFPDVPPGTPWHPSLAAALDSPDRPAVVTLSTPLHTHVALAVEALAAGCDVMLEKPPAPSLAAYHDLTAKAQAAGRLCQVGFQTFGSDAFERIAALVADGAVGALERVGAVGLWVRDEAYWSRAPWSGRRQLDGHPVVDGAVTNPFAHAVATALRLGGVRGAGDVAEVAVDLWRANPIEADDTSAVRVTTTAGLPIALALSTCAPLRLPARVTLYGTAGRIVYFYETDRIEVYDRDEVRLIQASRGPLFDDLLDARNRGDGRLRCALADVGGFMTVLEAVRTAPAVRPIDPAHVTWAGAGPARHAVVHDVEAWAERVAASSLTFTEAGAPWTRPATFLTTCSSEGTAHA